MIKVDDRVMVLSHVENYGGKCGTVVRSRLCIRSDDVPPVFVQFDDDDVIAFYPDEIMQLPPVMTPERWRSMTVAEQRSYVQVKSKRIGASTFIDDETITYGFGKLDKYGCWEYPCMWRVNDAPVKEDA